MISTEKIISNNEYNYDVVNADKINSNDVLGGRGGLTNLHIGNKNFRYIVAEHQLEYLKARKCDKRKIALAVVSRIRENGGRFLQRTSDANIWYVVSDKRATEKTSQALREGLDVRHKTLRPRKYVPKQKKGRKSLADPKKYQSLARGIVVDTPRIRKALQENIPDLEDESTMQSFEPLFTFPQSTIVIPPAMDCHKMHQI
eukprot:CAMPEP_0197185282 /NCGR_PEP_ID=MMETSP1423-20130617/11601_1 /TAXON_ID=476441 /ORGANISM="Pseudo-nitzschia heimii, Strain UNC1101" /LENGTH=200 /DNA_ID=CAMNT_0042636307 /DNA_START=158 /DNA_END=760 /DNA_ORIENTATION=+